MKTILVLGRNGQVGFELQRTLAPLGKVVALDSWQLDLNKPDNIRKVVSELAPAVIVNAAAYTAVDKAESERDIAFRVNAIAPGVLAEEAKKLGALLVHYSTDYVFDGTRSGPYVETDATVPTSIYGLSKLAGEQAIQVAGGDFLIFRTSWVFGVRGHNFLLTMLRLAKERDSLRVVADQHGAPTWSRMIAEATALAIQRNFTPHPSPLTGVYHLTGQGQTTWHGFAQGILREYQQRHAQKGWPELKVQAAQIEAITTEQYPTPAKRPANSVLDNTKLLRDFGLQLPDWKDSLVQALDEAATLAV
jgi:dTDP-4-dehydrorhamnose reductase